MEVVKYSSDSNGCMKVVGSINYSVNVELDDILKWIDLQESPVLLDIVRHHVYFKMLDAMGEEIDYKE